MVRVICLAVAGVVLTGALALAAVNGSPYERLKNAVLDAMTYTNVTIQGEAKVSFNGEVYEIDRIHEVISDTGRIEFYYNSLGEPDRFFYNSDGLQIRPSVVSADGTQWYVANRVRNSSSWNSFTLTPEERSSAQFRFFELLVDLMIGDLKNNFTMSTNDGITRVSGTITHNQLPEIIRLGIDMVLEEERRWYREDFGVREDYSHPMHIPIQSLTINRISGDADIDDQGNLIYVDIYVSVTVINVFGDSNDVEFTAAVSFSDIGTSVVQSPVPGVAELITREFMESQFGTVYNLSVYFTRNADGSINSESVTTTWPGGVRTVQELSSPVLYDDEIAIQE